MDEPPLPDAPAAEGNGEPQSAPVIECPECSAKLRNIRALAGERIRCLNCGAKFSLNATLDAVPLAAAPETQTVREPKSAGYWILRFPPLIFAAIAPFGFMFLMYIFLRELFGHGMQRFDRLTPFLYAPLILVLAFFAVIVTRALARVEAGALKAAWRAGLVTESLPVARGSSLPYILPLAVGPVLIFIVNLVEHFNNESSYNTEFVIGAGVFAPIAFVLAFMADDLRQFLWRQRVLAETCARSTGNSAAESGCALVPLVGLLPAFALIFFGTMFAALGLHDSGTRREFGGLPMVIYAIGIITLFGTAVTILLLGLAFRKVIAAWRRAAGGSPASARFLPNEFDPIASLLRLPLYLFVVVSVGTIIESLTSDHLPTDWVLYVMFSVSGMCGAIFLSLTLTRIYAEVRRWRKAQILFWLKRGTLSAKPALSWFFAVTVYGTIAAAFVLGLIFLVTFHQRSFSHPIKNIVVTGLLCFSAHFPIVWMALMAREFMLADTMASRLKESSEQPAAAPAHFFSGSR